MTDTQSSTTPGTRTHWEDSGWGVRITSVDELMRLVIRIPLNRPAGERVVWRGVPCGSWQIESSLQRALCTQPDYYAAARDEYGPSELRQAERSLIALAREWGIGANNGAFHTDLQVLATLQHHGVPTRLLDVTTDPATALWFACALTPSAVPGDSQDAALFAISVSQDDERPTMATFGGTLGEFDDGLAWSLNCALRDARRRPVLVRPAFPDARMSAQAGCFLVGDPPAADLIENYGIHPVPGIEAFTYDVADTMPSREPMRALLDGPPSDTNTPISFGALIIPRALVPEIRRSILEQHDKTYRSLLPDPAGLADAVRSRAVELPQPQRRSTPTHSDAILAKGRDADARAQQMHGIY